MKNVFLWLILALFFAASAYAQKTDDVKKTAVLVKIEKGTITGLRINDDGAQAAGELKADAYVENERLVLGFRESLPKGTSQLRIRSLLIFDEATSSALDADICGCAAGVYRVETPAIAGPKHNKLKTASTPHDRRSSIFEDVVIGGVVAFQSHGRWRTNRMHRKECRNQPH